MSIDAIARASQERAEDRGAIARRLIGELGPHKRRLAYAFVFVVIGALAQPAGPALLGRAIDRHILAGDKSGLARTMLLLLATYVAGTLATRGQIFLVGTTGQRVLAALRLRLFER